MEEFYYTGFYAFSSFIYLAFWLYFFDCMEYVLVLENKEKHFYGDSLEG